MHIRQILLVHAMAGGIGVAAMPATAPTDYYDTDRNRPIRIEDARGAERGAVKLKVAPVTLDWRDGDGRRWEIDPEIAWGLLPRTTVELGVPVHVEDQVTGDRSVSVPGILLSVFHSLNVETRTIPALAVRGDLLVARSGSRGVRPALTGIATRTFAGVRVHANVLIGGGGARRDGSSDGPPRWLAGVAVDRTFPLDAFLITASVHAGDPAGARGTEWVVASGIRYQVSPYVGLDAGIGRRFGEDPGWTLTLGNSVHLAVPGFLRGSGGCCAPTPNAGAVR